MLVVYVFRRWKNSTRGREQWDRFKLRIPHGGTFINFKNVRHDGRRLHIYLEERHEKLSPKEVEEQEDEHLYHTTGWCRELWIQSLGLPAVLPPPEEEKEVKTAIGAARAKQARKAML